MKGKTKQEKGITLIALIITIVVLLILAAVAISSIGETNIIAHTENSAGKYNNSVTNEQTILGGYEGFLNQYSGGSGSGNGEQGGEGSGGDQSQYETATTVANAKTSGKPYQNNTTITDDYGNKVKVPAGFKIASDSATAVTGGVVIEDATYTTTIGSQFVWIPVGKVYTDNTTEKETTAKTITLGRYVFADGNTDYDGDGTNETAGEIVTSLTKTNPSDELKLPYFSKYQALTEGLKGATINHNTTNHARDIEAFIASTDPITGNAGYYIGRYEARTNNTTGRTNMDDDLTAMTTIQTNAVYNYVKQSQASSLSQGMYADGYKTDGTGTFSSDLINSYAWDTAIVFLQAFDNRTDKTKPYSLQNSLNKNSLKKTGTTTDVICNIYDMASNCYEWSTENFHYRWSLHASWW